MIRKFLSMDSAPRLIETDDIATKREAYYVAKGWDEEVRFGEQNESDHLKQNVDAGPLPDDVYAEAKKRLTEAVIRHSDLVQAVVADDPSVLGEPGPYGISLMAHARKEGKEAAEVVKLLRRIIDHMIESATSPQLFRAPAVIHFAPKKTRCCTCHEALNVQKTLPGKRAATLAIGNRSAKST